MTEFLEQLRIVLCETSPPLDSMVLGNSPNWDSMTHLVIAAWIHRETGHLVSAEEIKQAKTIADLKAIYASKI